jgi:tRNA (adenine57-N1/adenine58-N1)-methyltransferase
MASSVSPFFNPGVTSTADKLSIIHLKRDLLVPTILKDRDEDDEGYNEGKVVNTRFGSFPHSTLIGLPWGSQVRASKVDTGSRGRRIKCDKKRKREDPEAQDGLEQREDTPTAAKEAVAAASGFIHLLPPTPETWTSSLPHRTQVVYTPDYSYILHRLRARPGTSVIEAGAGSGSFTHASARAVYNGYPRAEEVNGQVAKKRKLGKVWSFEFHEQRSAKLEREIQDHDLEGIVQITHRDVCENGFLVGNYGDESPYAEAVFLDLPAPWLALPHLTRRAAPQTEEDASTSTNGILEDLPSSSKTFLSPLNPNSPIHICTFSPCIEQVQRTVSVMRQLGWIDIEMVEIAQKRLEIRRERVGIDNGAQRGVQATPANVDEALARLIEVEGRFKSFHEGDANAQENGEGDGDHEEVVGKASGKKQKGNLNNREKIIESLVDRKIYKEGKLTHRTESEVKGHTSYLVFAILPQEWTAEDEARAREKWPLKIRSTEVGGEGEGEVVGVSRRQMKKAARQAQKDKAATIDGAGQNGGPNSA